VIALALGVSLQNKSGYSFLALASEEVKNEI